MAISFPRAIPNELRVVGMTFTLEPMIELTPTRGGKIISSDLGPSLWKAHYESGTLTNEQFGIVRAWRDTLQSREQFLAYDKWREYPIAHKNGWGSLTVSGSPFSGNANLKSIGSAVLLTLDQLPTTGLVLSPGDYLAFDYGANGSRALHRIVAGGQSSSGQLQVEVRPFIRATSDDEDATVSLFRPAAKMIMLPDTYHETTALPDMGAISFDAIQAL